MIEMPLALLITDRPASVFGLRSLLESLGFAVYAAANLSEAALLFVSTPPPHLVFTDTDLTDGTWEEVLSLARKCEPAINVIVISRTVDVSLYIQVLESGAYDFIVPPFELAEVEHVIRNGMASVRHRREMARVKTAAVAGPRHAPLGETEPSLSDDDLQIASVA